MQTLTTSLREKNGKTRVFVNDTGKYVLNELMSSSSVCRRIDASLMSQRVIFRHKLKRHDTNQNYDQHPC